MNEPLTWAGWAVAVVAGIFAIRANVRFDINEWLKDRRNQKERNLRMLCPHVRVSDRDGRLNFNSTYVSPPGTLAWQCQMCGNITQDDAAVQENTAWWAVNPNELSERNDKIMRLLKKLGRA